jgi:hypothetical protein
MGGFLTNVQVRAGNLPPAQVRRTVIEALTDWVTANGFDQDASRKHSDRDILVTSADNAGWISVYDELTELQYDALLTQACIVLSERTNDSVVGVLVHDSDVLVLTLAHQGRFIDQYVSDPGYLDPQQGEEEGSRGPRYLGDPSLWSGLLSPGLTPQDLATVWSVEQTFAEDRLREVAEVLSIPSKQVLLGYNFLSELPPDPAMTRLSFRCTAPVATEAADIVLLLELLKEKKSETPEAQRTIEQLEAQV